MTFSERIGGTLMPQSAGARVAIFGPNPLLSITIESRGSRGDDIHLHAGGQGVWVARMAAELGASPVLCALSGGEPGAILSGLLERMPGERRLVRTAAASGSYVVDRRRGERETVAAAWAQPPSRHEVDDLFSTCCATALGSAALVVCNPYPGESLPLEVYGNLVSDARSNGVPVLVDLSSPRLDSALAARPDLVKINDWELAEYVQAPVSAPHEMRAAVDRLREHGAQAVAITRAERPIFVVDGERSFEIAPPAFERGAREGCGDSMMGGIAAGYAHGLALEDCLRLGAAAGAANFLRHGLGTGSRGVVLELADRVELHAA